MHLVLELTRNEFPEWFEARRRLNERLRQPK
jgi:hypothetical protein